MKKNHLTFPEEIILQFLQDNEEGVRQTRSTTSSWCLDKKVEEFLNRPIEKEIPYLFVDASHCKVRDEKAGRYKTKALLIVAGIREDGAKG